MISVYLEKIDENENIMGQRFNSLPRSVKEKIKETKNERLCRERICAYSLALRALKDFDLPEEKIEKDFAFSESGKPYLKECDIELSISHSGGMAAVAVCCGRSCGVDIEKAQKEKFETVRRITDKYSKTNLEVCFDLYDNIKTVTDEYGRITRLNSNEKDDISPFLKWCSVEAALKCDGGGFLSASRLDDISKEVKICLFRYDVGNEIFAVSLAIKDKT